MSEDERAERADEQPVVNTTTPKESRPQIDFTSPFESPMVDSYRDAKFRTWVNEVDARYVQRQYAARHINRA